MSRPSRSCSERSEHKSISRQPVCAFARRKRFGNGHSPNRSAIHPKKCSIWSSEMVFTEILSAFGGSTFSQGLHVASFRSSTNHLRHSADRPQIGRAHV